MFSATVFLTLVVVIAANSALFALVDAVLLKPLPVRNPSEVVMLWEDQPLKGLTHQRVAAAKVLDWAQATGTFAGFAPFLEGRSVNTTDSAEPEHLAVVLVTAEFFNVLGVRTQLGRAIEPGDLGAGAERVVVISDGMWRRKFGRQPTAVGARIFADGQPLTIVGVMKPDQQFPHNVELWLPLTDADVVWSSRAAHSLSVAARLRQGQRATHAQAALNQIAKNLSGAFPSTDQGWTIRVVPIRDELLGPVEATLVLLMIAALLVFVLACVNIANLFFARAWIRQRDTAIRLALGASSTRVAMQSLLEGLELAFAAGVVGFLIGVWLDRLLASTMADYVAGDGVVGGNFRVALFTVAVAAVAGSVVTVVPALRLSHTDLEPLLRDAGRGVSESWRRHPLVGGLLVIQVGLMLPLVTAATLFSANLAHLDRVALGFDPQSVLTARVALPRNPYASPPARIALADRLTQTLREMPAVRSVGVTNALPFSGLGAVFRMQLPPEVREIGRTEEPIEYRTVSPGFFAALRIPLVAGRTFTDADQLGRPVVYIVNMAAREQFWPGRSPIGQQVSFRSSTGPWGSVVGLVGDVRHFGLDSGARPEVYAPYAQDPWPAMTLAVQTSTDPLAFVPALRGVLHQADAALPAFDIQTMEQRVDRTLAQPRVRTSVSLAFAIVAFTLTIVGVFGLVWGTVREGQHEMGIRSALGARPNDLIRLAVIDTLKRVSIGTVLGLGAAAVVARIIGGGAQQDGPSTVTILSSITAVVSAVVFLAAYLPARKAARVDPTVVMRM